MGEMIERVARAMATAEGDTKIGWHWSGTATERLWTARARAAIEAMREPTEAMLDAAEETNTGGGITDHGNAEPDLYEPETVWQAMIDAALTEAA